MDGSMYRSTSFSMYGLQKDNVNSSECMILMLGKLVRTKLERI